MNKIAALYTCFNRKEKTLEALRHLFQARDAYGDSLALEVFLTDDGSTDGTAEAVRKAFPQVHILKGSGNLYWAGGMRNSWNAALEHSAFDAFLLLNDDTFVNQDLFGSLLATHAYGLEHFGSPGIYIGSTTDPSGEVLTYGGAVFQNRFLAKYKKVQPHDSIPQECELGNANIMMVRSEVVNRIGILSKGYIHGLADFDYTLQARKRGIPVLVAPGFLGACVKDKVNPFPNLHKLSLSERIALLFNPVGLDFKSNLRYMRRNFPIRLPFVFLAGWMKVLFPRVYQWRHKSMV